MTGKINKKDLMLIIGKLAVHGELLNPLNYFNVLNSIALEEWNDKTLFYDIQDGNKDIMNTIINSVMKSFYLKIVTEEKTEEYWHKTMQSIQDNNFKYN